MKLIAAILGLVAGFIAWARRDAKRDARKEAALVAAEQKSKQLEDMYDAQNEIGLVPDDAREWLRNRAKQ